VSYSSSCIIAGNPAWKESRRSKSTITKMSSSSFRFQRERIWLDGEDLDGSPSSQQGVR
jgi:hypothetical protein